MSNNDVVIEAWNTVLFEKFSRFKYLFIEGGGAICRDRSAKVAFSSKKSQIEDQLIVNYSWGLLVI